MKQFPRLNYPMRTEELTRADRLIVLAYDIIWQSTYGSEIAAYKADRAVTLHELGRHIEFDMLNGGKHLFDSADMPDDELF